MTMNLNVIGKNITFNTVQLQKDTLTSTTTLAAITGVSVRTLNRIEAAKKARQTYRPALSTVVKLAEASGVTVDDFIKNRLIFQ